MKTIIQIFFKFMIIVLFFMVSPFADGIKGIIQKDSLATHLVYSNPQIDGIELKNKLNYMDLPVHEEIEDNESEEEAVIQKPAEPVMNDANGKKIYIYSTHQQESYSDGMNVVDGSNFLAEQLRQFGFTVVVETADFALYGKENQLDYEQYYAISRKFITDAIMREQGFDLIIDFHRDSLPRESTYLSDGNKDYAKLMSVVGTLSGNDSAIIANSSTLYDSCNTVLSGIMKNTMTREAYYNQDMSEVMMLIEVGSDTNNFNEVKNSLVILAKGIDELMR